MWGRKDPLKRLADMFIDMFKQNEELPPGIMRTDFLNESPGERPIFTIDRASHYFAELMESGRLPDLNALGQKAYFQFLGAALMRGFVRWDVPYDDTNDLLAFDFHTSEMIEGLDPRYRNPGRQVLTCLLVPLVLRRALEIDRSLVQLARHRHNMAAAEEQAAEARRRRPGV